jgi:hypothetical protein
MVKLLNLTDTTYSNAPTDKSYRTKVRKEASLTAAIDCAERLRSVELARFGTGRSGIGSSRPLGVGCLSRSTAKVGNPPFSGS